MAVLHRFRTWEMLLCSSDGVLGVTAIRDHVTIVSGNMEKFPRHLGNIRLVLWGWVRPRKKSRHDEPVYKGSQALRRYFWLS